MILKEQGVQFIWEKALTKLEVDGAKIVSAFCGEEKIQGDIYVLSINHFFTADILSSIYRHCCIIIHYCLSLAVMGLPASSVRRLVINGHRSTITIYVRSLITVVPICLSWIVYKYQIDIMKYVGK